MPDPDPYRHHPELRGRIRPAAESFFRDLDLDALDARLAEAGMPADWRTPDDVREAARRAWLDGHLDADLWVFAYGSLMWDPGVEFAEIRRARTACFARSFSLWDAGGRGTADRPGLMLAIDAGDGCEGLAFRIEAGKTDHETFVLFRREMIAEGYRPVWLDMETAEGPIVALGFAADRDCADIVPDIPVPEQARMIAAAQGFLGTNFDYLDNVHAHLALLGIEDAYVAEVHARALALRAPA